MTYYVSVSAACKGDGTRKRPFRTISEAAALAGPDDIVSVGPGIYRESVNPLRGGTDEAHRVTYRSEVPGGAVISGAEIITGWERVEGNVWKVSVSNELFGSYNPYTTPIRGDWYFAPTPLHTGEIYLNGHAMYECVDLEEVYHPSIYRPSWEPEWTVHKWYTVQEGENTVLFANFQGADPNRETVEINVRQTCFYPSQIGVGYITLSGFVIRQAATQWAPPTAYQVGMVGPHWARGWIIEDCEISDSRCSGISLGKYLQPDNENKWSAEGIKDGAQTERETICQAVREGWNREHVGSHIIRRCNIHHCGQTGIVGHLGGVFSIIEDNHIHHINNKQDLAGAEIGGIKMHAAIDVIYRRNHIHHCTRGLWLDWQAQGTRVTGNLFHDNTPPVGTEITNGLSLGEDIFIEVSHGPTLVDNNILLSDCAVRLSTQGTAFVHNLIAGSFTYVGAGTENQTERLPSERYTPYHVPHDTAIAGFMTILHGDDRFYNNIFVQKPMRPDLEQYIRHGDLDANLVQLVCGTKPFDDYPTQEEYEERFARTAPMSREDKDRYYDHLPVWTGGNVYFNGARPCNREVNFWECTGPTVSLDLSPEGVLTTDLFEFLPKQPTELLSTTQLGIAFEPEQPFEAPDGSPIRFDTDYFGRKRDGIVLSGPFAEAADQFELF